ncbi:hypothetical protein HNO88_000273 [Novosphingobium chloroacetimidivorans]|uniref:Uncharacterized protein n=1 Tax=Novosphingobium chloroacetimidivorans TaxID=1428314 RepID=A0A7W7K6C0_9SPHN|nr:hypothetical protein [Novosphingobium chloroacetimidivorans]MBB4856976.1 hypothetical protein [Novosphingobium chloroacetimidivorans]
MTGHHASGDLREGRHCYPFDPYDTEGIAEEIDRQETQRAIEAEQERGHDWYVPLNGVVYGMGETL